MDVRHWLENTVDREPPDRSELHSIANFLQPRQEPEPENQGRKHRHKRRRPSSDSSLVEPQHSAQVRREHYTHSPNKGRGAAHALARLPSRHSSQSSHAPHKTYERRARHKTRPDLYEHKPRHDRKERRARDDGKKTKRHRSHRARDGGPTTGLVESFRLRTGPKNSRLTLKPDANGGLFKHGRASAQVTGCGPGLPDLASNEMRFLQKPQERQDIGRDDGERQLTDKNDRQRLRNKEISAYFGAQKVDSPKRETERHRSASTQREVEHLSTGRQKLHSKEELIELLPVKLPDKPFLGFGSRGDRHESHPEHPESDSCYTWSESQAAGLEKAEGRHLEAPTIEVGQLSALRKRQASPDVARRDPQAYLHDQPTLIESNAGTWVESHRVRGPTRVDVYRPPASSVKETETHRRAVTGTTEQSLPRSSSLIRRFARLRRADPQKHNESHPTSDILKVRPFKHMNACSSPYSSRDATNEEQPGKENQDPRSSTPTGRLLRQAQQAVEAGLQTALRPLGDRAHKNRRPTQKADYHREPSRHRPSEHEVHQDIRRYDNVLSRKPLELADPAPHQAATAIRPTSQARPRQHYQGPSHQAPSVIAPTHRQMLDDGPDIEHLVFGNNPVHADARQAEELVYDVIDHEPNVYTVQAASLGVDEDALLMPSEFAQTRTPSTRYLADIHDSEHQMPTAGGEDRAADELDGFWKPNILY